MTSKIFQILLCATEEGRTAADLLSCMDGLEGASVPPIATFYRDLKRAEEAGWIEVEEASQEQLGPGRPAHVYRLTPAGHTARHEEALRLRMLAANVLSDADPPRR